MNSDEQLGDALKGGRGRCATWLNGKIQCRLPNGHRLEDGILEHDYSQVETVIAPSPASVALSRLNDAARLPRGFFRCDGPFETTLDKYHGELWLDPDGTANFKWHIEGGDFKTARHALVRFIQCLQHRLDNEQACPHYKSDTSAASGDLDVAPEGSLQPSPKFGSAKGEMIIAEDFVAPLSLTGDRYAEGFAAGVKAAVQAVPANWTDDLLSGPKAGNLPWAARQVERLLRKIQDRIRMLRSDAVPQTPEERWRL